MDLIPSPQRPRLHPLVVGAAVSIILVSLVGVAAMTGLLPTSQSSPSAQLAPSRYAPVEPATAVPAPGTSTTASMAVPASASGASLAPAPQLAQTAPLPDRPADKPIKSSTAHAASDTVAAVCHTCGTVETIQAVEQPAEHGSGVGTVAGAVLGGVLGNQVGGGTGRTLATVAGAVGGGVAGNQIERRHNSTTRYHIVVRMEDGRQRTFVRSQSAWQVGDRVKVVNGDLRARG